jgi:hypothetical protein
MLSASVQTQCPSTICSSSLLRDHNSAVEWAVHRLPGGLQSSKEKAKVQVKVQTEVRTEL